MNLFDVHQHLHFLHMTQTDHVGNISVGSLQHFLKISFACCNSFYLFHFVTILADIYMEAKNITMHQLNFFTCVEFASLQIILRPIMYFFGVLFFCFLGGSYMMKHMYILRQRHYGKRKTKTR